MKHLILPTTLFLLWIVCIIILLGRAHKPQQLTNYAAVNRAFVGVSDSFMYGPGAGNDLTSGTCDIFIGAEAGKGVKGASYKLVIQGDFSLGMLVDIEYQLQRDNRNYYQIRNKECNDLYDKAFWQVSDIIYDTQNLIEESK